MTTLGTAPAQHLMRISDLRAGELVYTDVWVSRGDEAEQAVLYALTTGEWE